MIVGSAARINFAEIVRNAEGVNDTQHKPQKSQQMSLQQFDGPRAINRHDPLDDPSF